MTGPGDVPGPTMWEKFINLIETNATKNNIQHEHRKSFILLTFSSQTFQIRHRSIKPTPPKIFFRKEHK